MSLHYSLKNKELYKMENIVSLKKKNGGFEFHGAELLSVSRHENWSEFDQRTVCSINNILDIGSSSLFINLTSESIMSIENEEIERASENKKLVIEWTEKTHSPEMVRLSAKKLVSWRNNFNIKIALDDVGAGQDGMERFLLTIPDYCKVDGNLLHKARHCARHRRAIKHFTRWARSEGSALVIEWIENEEDLKFAKECKAEFGQGFYFNEQKIVQEKLLRKNINNPSI